MSDSLPQTQYNCYFSHLKGWLYILTAGHSASNSSLLSTKPKLSHRITLRISKDCLVLVSKQEVNKMTVNFVIQMLQ